MNRGAFLLIRPLMLALFFVGYLTFPTQSIATTETATPTISTTEGPIQGRDLNGLRVFKGIPYALAPVGPLRWRPPKAPVKRRKLLIADRFALSCPQVTTLGVYAGPTSVAEDCLYLNIFAPAGAGTTSPRPVIVWLHGGGHLAGTASDYDGGKLALGGPLGSQTVVVTINYRLGVLGFLAHPALASEDRLAGNYGLLDVLRALQWVRANIASFGGDPNNVTLGGQSAGASLTSAAMISPMAAGLFHRAILQSGPLSVLPSMATALQRGSAMAHTAGCDGNDERTAACLRALPVPQLLQLQGRLNESGPFFVGPMIDGTIINRSPMDAWTAGAFNRVPVLGGTVQDEGQFAMVVSAYTSGDADLTPAQYEERVRRRYVGPAGPGGTGPAYPADAAAKVLAAYPIANYADAGLAFGATQTDPIVCRANRALVAMAQWVPAYGYEFQYRDAPFYFPPQGQIRPLAAHTIDLQFLFPGWHGGMLGINHRPQGSWAAGEIEGPEIVLSDRLIALWTKFSDRGDPGEAGGITWPAFKSSQSLLAQNVPDMSLIDEAAFRDNHHCELWDELLVY